MYILILHLLYIYTVYLIKISNKFDEKHDNLTGCSMAIDAGLDKINMLSHTQNLQHVRNTACILFISGKDG